MPTVTVRAVDYDAFADTLCVICDFEGCGDEFAGHPVFFAPEAIGNRIAGYGLVNGAEAALNALLSEHMLRLHPDLEPQSESRSDALGGTDDRITVVWAADAEPGKAEQLDAHADRIEAARIFYQGVSR